MAILPYVVSADLESVSDRLIDSTAIDSFRSSLTSDLESMGKQVSWLEYEDVRSGINGLLAKTRLSVISLDDRYVQSADCYLGISRCVNEDLSNAGYDSRVGHGTVRDQLDAVGRALEGQEAVLADDVVYTGENACWLVDELGQRGVKVASVICGVAIGGASSKLANRGIEVDYVHAFDAVDDEICERDFAVVRGSGRKVAGSSKSALYFDTDYGKPAEWASIPPDFAKKFCVSSIVRSQQLVIPDVPMTEVGNFLGYDCTGSAGECLASALDARS